MPVLSWLGIVLCCLVKGKVTINSTVRTMVRLGIWLTAVSFIAIIIWAVAGNEMVLYGEWLPIKAMKILLQYFSFPAYISLLLTFMKNLTPDEVCVPIFITLIILTLICIVELRQIPYAFQSIHFYGKFPYYRVRLLTRESSWTTMLICNYFTISIFYALQQKKPLIGIISIICAIILLVSSGAKSLLATIAIAIIIYFLLTIKKINNKSIFSIIGVIIIAILFIVKLWPQLNRALIADMASYTSVATRIYTIFIGILIGILIPTGLGGGIYLGVFPKVMKSYLFLFDKLSIILNTSEIYNLIYGPTDDGLSVKSGIVQYNMLWGIVG